jgi:TonB family protein
MNTFALSKSVCMKKMLLLLFTLLCLGATAKNTITYLKLERTPCFGKCRSYTVEFLKTGEVVYNGKANVKMLGTWRAKMTKTAMRNFFRQFEKYTYSKLSSKYHVLSSDLPGMNIAVTVNGKLKKVTHADAGPRFLTQIGADMDEQVDMLQWTADDPPDDVLMDVDAVPVEEIKATPEVYEFVEQMPEFPGGDAAMKNYLQANIKYPELAKESGIQGKVFCNFVVDKEGNVTNVKVLRGIGYGCDQEALRVIKAMPTWTPGKQNGRNVNVHYNLPVFFKLQ